MGMTIFQGFEHVVRADEALAPYTWLRLGGTAQFFAEPTTVDELVGLVRRAHAKKVPVRVLGGGSNLLIRSEGIQGLVLYLSNACFAKIERQGNRLIAGAGAKLAHLLSIAAREGLAGLEELAAIPGTVGGALRGNATAHSGDIGQRVVSATMLTVDGSQVVRRGDQLRFAHHYSNLDELVILEAEFALEPGDPLFLTKRMQQNWILQKANQPLSEDSCGRLFKDPVGGSAAQVIDDAGLKGLRVGEAQLSTRNSNFVVADRGCHSRDVLALIDEVQKKVEQRLGVKLEPTIECW
jgi:UDP-N-acetylmuramate dehydrogenase